MASDAFDKYISEINKAYLWAMVLIRGLASLRA